MTHRLTPGAKKFFLTALLTLTTYVNEEKERECIMFWTAQLMPMVVSELNYYTPPKKVPKKRLKE